MNRQNHVGLNRGAPPVLLLLILSVLTPQLTFACSCGTTTLAARFARADNVFTAVVIDEYIEPSDDRYPVRSLYSITESFKGAPSFGALISHPDDNICGIDIDAGVEYLFFVPDSGEIGLCGGIREVDRAGPELSAQRLRAVSGPNSPK